MKKPERTYYRDQEDEEKKAKTFRASQRRGAGCGVNKKTAAGVMATQRI